MADDLYFDGDPAEDSRRRHLERVIKGGPPRRRWPWVMAILAGGALTAWRITHPKQNGDDNGRRKPGASGEEKAASTWTVTKK